MKRLITLVLTLLLLAFCMAVPALAAAEAVWGKYYGIDWRFDYQTDTLILSGTGDMPKPQDMYPWYKKYPWFKVHSLTKHLVIQEGITVIGEKAFLNFSELEDVSLPESLEEIGIYAFSACTSLRSIELSGSLQRIGNYAFENCISLKSVTFSEGLREIDGYCFSGCKKLEQLALPKSLDVLGEGAFEDCTGLTQVDFHWGLDMNPNAFDGCGELPEVTRYLLLTKGWPLLAGLLVLLSAWVWSVISLYRIDKYQFHRRLAKGFLTVVGAVALAWLLGLLWNKLGLYKYLG